jgi:hypothetical protein
VISGCFEDELVQDVSAAFKIVSVFTCLYDQLPSTVSYLLMAVICGNNI